MLRFLFPRLTAAPERGEEVFAAVSATAREPHWYLQGDVPDTLDGRFRMLATLTALVIVRLEQGGDAGEAGSVALTERFIEVMEAEHRELGLGDPALGKTVRKLVGALARRVELWRSAVADPAEWQAAAKDSVHGTSVSPAALSHVADSLRSFWSELEGSPVSAVAEGQMR